MNTCVLYDVHEPAAATTAAPDRDLLGAVRMLPGAVFRCARRADGRMRFSLMEGELAEEFHLATADVGSAPLDEVLPGDSGAVIERLERAFAGHETEFVHELDGRHFKLNARPVRDAEGRVVAVAGTTTEVTELVRAEGEVQRLRQELVQQLVGAAAARARLEASGRGLAHDLRTPLTVIRTQCELLEMALETEDGTTARLNRIRSATGRMNGLIDGILDLSRHAASA